MSIPMTAYPVMRSISTLVRSDRPRSIRRRANQMPTRYPMKYMTPYHRRRNGPRWMMSGGIRGYGMGMIALTLLVGARDPVRKCSTTNGPPKAMNDRPRPRESRALDEQAELGQRGDAVIE